MDKLRLAVIGSRTFEDYDLLCEWIGLVSDTVVVVEIVSGGCKRGGDALAKRYAEEHGVRYKEFPANWSEHGRSAGFIRNKLIVDNADVVLAFWDRRSAGTKNTIALSTDAKKPVIVVTFSTTAAAAATQTLFKDTSWWGLREGIHEPN